MRRMLEQTFRFGSSSPPLERGGWSPLVGVGLPDHVDEDKIEASLAQGVLSVRLPKSERAQRRRIELRS